MLNSKLRLDSGIPKTFLVVFAKYTCRMLDSFRLINSVNIWVFCHWDFFEVTSAMETSLQDISLLKLSNESWWEFFVKWELMSNKWLVYLHFPKQYFTQDSGFCSETIAVIYFKLFCKYIYKYLFISILKVYKPIYFCIYLFASRLT